MSASGDSSPFDILRFGIGFSNARSIGQFVAGAIVAVLAEVTLGIQSIIRSFLGGIAGIIEGIINAGLGLFVAIVGGGIKPIEFSFTAIGPLAVEQTGLFAPIVVTIIALGAVYILGLFLRREATGNLIPGFPDVVIIGREEDDDE